MRLRDTARRVRLLLCDDQALFRAGMKAVLAEHSAIEVVGEAADGQAAIEETARLRPDVVLMDVEMPRLNGVEATRRITRAHHDVRILMLSMYDEPELVARCLEAGASGYLLKDAAVADLAGAIEAVAAGGRYVSPVLADSVVGEDGLPVARNRTRYDLLTDREREVLKLLADGLSIREIAARLDRSLKTAQVHKYNLMHKLDVHHQTGLVRYAIAHRLVQVAAFHEPS
jgi:two-component system, NarL family, response regulator NreC